MIRPCSIPGISSLSPPVEVRATESQPCRLPAMILTRQRLALSSSAPFPPAHRDCASQVPRADHPNDVAEPLRGPATTQAGPVLEDIHLDAHTAPSAGGGQMSPQAVERLKARSDTNGLWPVVARTAASGEPNLDLRITRLTCQVPRRSPSAARAPVGARSIVPPGRTGLRIPLRARDQWPSRAAPCPPGGGNIRHGPCRDGVED